MAHLDQGQQRSGPRASAAINDDVLPHFLGSQTRNLVTRQPLSMRKILQAPNAFIQKTKKLNDDSLLFRPKHRPSKTHPKSNNPKTNPKHPPTTCQQHKNTRKATKKQTQPQQNTPQKHQKPQTTIQPPKLRTSKKRSKKKNLDRHLFTPVFHRRLRPKHQRSA